MKNKTLVIAEAGVNHNGKLSIAKKMIEVAAKSGANIIKFQTFKANNIVTKDIEKLDYQINSIKKQTQYNLLKNLQISYKDHIKLIKHCKKFNIEFCSTAFDIKSLLFLKKMKISRFKVSSGDITNIPFLMPIRPK